MTGEKVKENTGYAVDALSGDVFSFVGENFPEGVLVVSMGTPTEVGINESQEKSVDASDEGIFKK